MKNFYNEYEIKINKIALKLARIPKYEEDKIDNKSIELAICKIAEHMENDIGNDFGIVSKLNKIAEYIDNNIGNDYEVALKLARIAKYVKKNINNDYYFELELEIAKLVEYAKTKNIACYLISLFYKSGRKYTCTSSKINRLLTIYKLCTVQYNPDCFHNSFFTDDTYMSIGSYISFLDRDIYVYFPYMIDNKEQFVDSFDENVNIPSKYHINEDDIDSLDKVLLEIIFRKFASYSNKDLAIMIDEMYDEKHHNIPFERKKDRLCNVYSYLDPEKFLSFLNSEENIELYKNNEIFNFIREFNNLTFGIGNINGSSNSEKIRTLIK